MTTEAEVTVTQNAHTIGPEQRATRLRNIRHVADRTPGMICRFHKQDGVIKHFQCPTTAKNNGPLGLTARGDLIADWINCRSVSNDIAWDNPEYGLLIISTEQAMRERMVDRLEGSSL